MYRLHKTFYSQWEAFIYLFFSFGWFYFEITGTMFSGMQTDESGVIIHDKLPVGHHQGYFAVLSPHGQ